MKQYLSMGFAPESGLTELPRDVENVDGVRPLAQLTIQADDGSLWHVTLVHRNNCWVEVYEPQGPRPQDVTDAVGAWEARWER